MIKVRKNVFETNSSSTHSISIDRLSNNGFKYKDIPKNKDIYIDETEFDKCGINITEWTKLNALIDFVIGYYNETDIFKEYNDNVTRKVDTEKPLFNIIKKLIKDECNSEITFGFYGRYRYQTDAYEKNSFMILFLDDDSTEENIYDRFKEIIFDPTMSFSHGENEY
jgi:hypothetical protein